VIDVEALLRDAEPERSLLLTFTLSLTHFEAALLAGLTGRGAAEVVILADASQSEACFGELGPVSGPGIHYRIFPVRLGRFDAFHPKLYFLASDDRMRLVVSSANLTLPGCRLNAEVVDVIDVSKSDSRNADAFRSFAALLDALPGVAPMLAPEGQSSIRRFASEIRAFFDRTHSLASRDGGVRLLHTAKDSLLSQVRELIPAGSIKRISAISPFFDQGSGAVRALLEAYPRATLRIFKRPGKNDIDGKSLRPFFDRLDVHEMLEVDGTDRRLHGKAYLFEGKGDDAWIVCGSPNFTAAAWNSAATKGGHRGANLEAATFRRIGRKTALARLFDLVKTKRVNHKQLQESVAEITGDRVDVEHQSLVITSADVRGGKVIVHVATDGYDFSDDGAEVRLESRSQRHVFRPEVRPTGEVEAPTIALAVALPSTINDEDPVVVTVTALHKRSGQVAVGRAWLTREWILAETADDRRLRRALHAFKEGEYGGADNLKVYVDSIGGIVSLWALADAQSEPDLNAKRGDHASHLDAPDKTSSDPGVRPADATVTRSELQASHRRTTLGVDGFLSRARDALDSLFEPLADESLEETPEIRLADDAIGSEPSESPRDARLATRPKARGISNEEAAALAGVLDRVCKLLKVRGRKPDTLQSAVEVFEHVVASAFLRMTVQANADGHRALAIVLKSLANAWLEALSVDGAMRGEPRGWIIRCLLDADCRATLSRVIEADPRRVSRLASAFAVASALVGENGLLGRGATINLRSAVLPSLCVVLGRSRLIEGDEQGPEIDDRIQNWADRCGIEIAADARALMAAPSRNDVPLARLSDAWQPLRAVVDSGLASAEIEQLRRTNPKLAELLRKAPRPNPIAAVAVSPQYTTCSVCDSVQPQSIASHVRAGIGQHACDACGRVLVPYDFGNANARQLLAEFESMFRA
jgi:hypothetical protein